MWISKHVLNIVHFHTVITYVSASFNYPVITKSTRDEWFLTCTALPREPLIAHILEINAWLVTGYVAFVVQRPWTLCVVSLRGYVQIWASRGVPAHLFYSGGHTMKQTRPQIAR